MRRFTQALRRVIELPSVDPALPPARWTLTVDSDGIQLRRFHKHGEPLKVGWRKVIEFLVVHKGKESCQGEDQRRDEIQHR